MSLCPLAAVPWVLKIISTEISKKGKVEEMLKEMKRKIMMKESM